MPKLEAAPVFEPDKWLAAFTLNKKTGAQENASSERSDPADSAARVLWGKKGDGETEAKTLWLGLQDIAIFVEGLRYAGEFGIAGTCV